MAKWSLEDREKEEQKRLEEEFPILEVENPEDGFQGVLLSDKIDLLARHHNLIAPYNDENLKSAGYELTVGDEYYLGNQKFHLGRESNNEIVIPPFEVVVIKTAETICLPRFLIARWNLRVRWAYKGLLWIGAAQVDPGYRGHLFCPIYNLSNQAVALPFGERIALMDFVKTSQFDPSKSQKYPGNSRPLLDSFFKDGTLTSALFQEVPGKLFDFEHKISSVETRLNVFTSSVIVLISVLIALISLLLLNGGEILESVPIWAPVVVSLSVFGFVFLLMDTLSKRPLLWLGSRVFQIFPSQTNTLRSFHKKSFWTGIGISIAVAAVIGGLTFWQLKSQFERLYVKGVATTEQIQTVSDKIDDVGKTRVTIDELEKLKGRLDALEMSIRGGPDTTPR
ncbi:MAG: hypothetical protein OXH94_07145 [Rhodospirillales bacterium]|nr:hypothetical protein [Rhodospirillales bacterium]